MLMEPELLELMTVKKELYDSIGLPYLPTRHETIQV